MPVHKSKRVWSSALVLTTLLWTAQFAADWFVPHSDIGIAQLGKIELAHVSSRERTDSSRAFRLENKPDAEASTSGSFTADANKTDRCLSTFSAENAHHRLAVALPGIRAPPHYFFSA